jgi:ElaB/YqjD/DUF883 family membrane-anchored ribosome-binding protein
MTSRTRESADSPRTVDEARDAVERSRERISSTLDALEDRIVEKKHELKDRANVLRPVRERIVERPFTAVAVAAGVGALLGSLGGGDDDGDTVPGRSGRSRRSGLSGPPVSADDRSEMRRWRRTRRERLGSLSHESDDSGRGDADSPFTGLKRQLMGAIGSALTAAVPSRVREYAASGLGRDGREDGNGGRYR